MDVDDIPRRWGLASLTALIALAVAPIWLCIAQAGASWTLVLAGGLIWLLSVCVKQLVVLAARAPGLPQPVSPAAKAVFQGVVSAATELGSAAAFLAAFMPLSFADIVAFGVGAGCAEVIYVLLLAIFGPKPDDEELRAWIAGAEVSLCVRYAVPIERAFALIGHAGARGLVALAFVPGGAAGMAAAAVALTLFATIDGVAVYGHLQKWPWHDPRICRQAHSFFAALSVAEAVLFLAGFEALG